MQKYSTEGYYRILRGTLSYYGGMQLKGGMQQSEFQVGTDGQKNEFGGRMQLYTQKHQLCSGEPTSNQNALVEGKKTCYSDLEFKIRKNPNHANPLKRASRISLPPQMVLTLAPCLPRGEKVTCILLRGQSAFCWIDVFVSGFWGGDL